MSRECALKDERYEKARELTWLSSSTGFWAGITVGRLIIPYLQNRFGERLVMYICIALSILLEISVWTWRQLIGNGTLNELASKAAQR